MMLSLLYRMLVLILYSIYISINTGGIGQTSGIVLTDGVNVLQEVSQNTISLFG